MKRMAGIVLTGLLLAAGTPALAGDAELASILFGKVYNDGVTAVQVGAGYRGRNGDVPLFVRHPSAALVRAAQAQAAGDPTLGEALSRRGIALHNVIWVQTAMNGGRIIYHY
ncbi:hypothetical protein [Ciceribacter azotifigens]|uniref:hypothetical protein n=1 Tax=Ciceribacter azotifigens TaxID=2069303 RepID=UPI003A84784E